MKLIKVAQEWASIISIMLILKRGLGEIYNHDEIFSTKQHAKILQQTTQNSKFALQSRNTNQYKHGRIKLYIEQHLLRGIRTQVHTTFRRSKRKMVYHENIKHWARTSEDSSSTCPIGMIEELIECIEEGLTPTQWECLQRMTRPMWLNGSDSTHWWFLSYRALHWP